MITMYHANAKGTGNVVRFELFPAKEGSDGYIYMSIANQKTVASRGVYPEWDWDNAIGIKLMFDDISHFLQVFRGECESIYEGKGLYHRDEDGFDKIDVRHVIEPVFGYVIDVYRHKMDESEYRMHVLLSSHEALGLMEAMSGSLGRICFG